MGGGGEGKNRKRTAQTKKNEERKKEMQRMQDKQIKKEGKRVNDREGRDGERGGEVE
jgi:hypothetical protein